MKHPEVLDPPDPGATASGATRGPLSVGHLRPALLRHDDQLRRPRRARRARPRAAEDDRLDRHAVRRHQRRVLARPTRSGFLLMGRLIDRVGTRLGYAVALVVWSLAAAGHALARTPFGFGVARFLLGLGEAGNFPAAVKTTAEWFPRRERALATGIFNAGSNIGAVLAPLVVPWHRARLRLAVGLRRHGAARPGLGRLLAPALRPARAGPAGLARGARLDPSDPPDVGRPIPWVQLLPHRQTWAVAAGKFLTDPIWWFYLFWSAKFLADRFGADLKQIGPPLIDDLPAGRRRLGRRRLAVVVAARRGAGRPTPRGRRRCWPAPSAWSRSRSPRWSSDMWTAVFLIGLAAAAHQGFSANMYTLASDMFPRRAVGSVIGIAGMAGAVGGILMQAASGRIKDLTGSYLAMFVVAGSVYVLSVAGHPRPRPPARPGAGPESRRSRPRWEVLDGRSRRDGRGAPPRGVGALRRRPGAGPRRPVAVPGLPARGPHRPPARAGHGDGDRPERPAGLRPPRPARSGSPASTSPASVRFSARRRPGRRADDWGNFPRGAAVALRARHRLDRGLVGVTAGRLHGGGVSSSAAVGVAFLLALRGRQRPRVSPEENIELDRRIENDYLGLRNGILDQAAVLLSRRGHLTRIDCRTSGHELIPAAAGHAAVPDPARLLGPAEGPGRDRLQPPGRRVRRAARTLLDAAGRAGAEPVLGNVAADEYAAHSTGSGPRPPAAPRTISPRSSGSARGSRPGGPATSPVRRPDDRVGRELDPQLRVRQPPADRPLPHPRRGRGRPGARFSGAGFRGCCVALVEPGGRRGRRDRVAATYARRHPDLAAHASVVALRDRRRRRDPRPMTSPTRDRRRPIRWRGSHEPARTDLPRSIAIAGAWGYIGRKFLDVALARGLTTYVFDPGPRPADLDPARFTRVADEAEFYRARRRPLPPRRPPRAPPARPPPRPRPTRP